MCCNPFPKKPFYGSHRLDPVMIRPPGSSQGVRGLEILCIILWTKTFSTFLFLPYLLFTTKIFTTFIHILERNKQR